MKQKRHRHTAEGILENLRLVFKAIGHVPTIKEYETHPLRICGETSINRKFGSFRKGLKAAGIIKDDNYKLLTDQEIIDNLLDIADKLGHPPTCKEYNNNPLRKVSATYLQHHFGSYNNALRKAELPVRIAKKLRERNNQNTIVKEKAITKYHYTKKQIIQNLQNIADNLGHTPTMDEYQKHPLHKVSISTILRRFKSWISALEQANLPASIKSLSRKLQKNKEKTSEHIVKKLMDDLYYNAIAHPDMSLHQIITTYCASAVKTYLTYIGPESTVKKMLRNKYGISIRTGRKNVVWTKSMIEEEFYRIQKLLNKVPTQKEMKNNSIYKNISLGITTIYGSYTALIIAMGCKPFSGHTTPEIRKLKQKYYISLLRKTAREQDTSKWPLYKFLSACNISYKSILNIFSSPKEWFKKACVKKPKLPNDIQISQIIRSLKKCAKDLSKIPTASDYKKYSLRICSGDTIINRFGSWPKALEAAGLK